ncbi:MAG: cell division topological specificity factor MinE [Candidatus Latescibacteria bacterium]|nr:cell division topological specificity factor MinE [Candidatus Latescibacterota bacterium]
MVNILRWFQRHETPSDTAKRRLQFVLVNNRAGLSPDLMEQLKNDIIKVVSRYLEINEDTTRIDWERSDDAIALVSSIEVKRVLRVSERVSG